MEWNIAQRDPSFRTAALNRQAALTKPAGALGRIERVAVWLADLQQTATPSPGPAAAIVFAADHPVSHLGVSAYPREVTPMMVVNLASGGAAASVLARHKGVPLHVVDVGAEPYPDPIPSPGVTWRRIAVGGTVGDLIETDAMDAVACAGAMQAGAEAVDALDPKTRVLILGEMGIGNTTPAAAVSARILGETGVAMAGPGTGVVGEALDRKRHLVQRALDRTAGTTNPLQILQRLGGREIAALVGAMGRAAERGMAILVDGFIVSSAALVAVQHDPRLRDYMWFGHRSAEPGHVHILTALSADPLVDAGLRLGEGSGALMALPLIEAAVALHNEMATFEEASVPDRED